MTSHRFRQFWPAFVLLLLSPFFFAPTREVRGDEPVADESATADPVEPAVAKDDDSPATRAKRDEEYELLKLFADTMDQVERNYVKDISRRELFEAATKISCSRSRG